MNNNYAQSARTTIEPRPPQRVRSVSSANAHRNAADEATTGIGSNSFHGIGSDSAPTNSISPKPKIVLRPLTKLEQKRMDTLPQRQKENRHSPQIVQGKEYHGSGFAPSPNIVKFIDFEVGKEYKQVIKLTNISYTFNSFKVEALPMEVRAVLDVVYVPQSRMVAGRESTIDVIFTPKENVDIYSNITITTVTGVLELPIQCLKKKSDVTVSSNLMDFGKVVIGEVASRSVTFKNQGALPCRLAIDGDGLDLFKIEHTVDNGANKVIPSTADAANAILAPPQSPLSAEAMNEHNGTKDGAVPSPLTMALTARPGTAATDASVATDVAANNRAASKAQIVRAFTSVPDFGASFSSGKQPILIVPPFSDLSLTVTFTPREVCHFETNFYFSADSPDVDDKVVFIKGEATALPIFISQNQRINFQCAFFDTLYRDSFTIANTSNSASKVTPVVPPVLASALEFVPKFGFAQAGSTLTFQIKFTPQASLAASYIQGRDGSVAFDQNVRVVVSDQTLPLYLSLVGRLSHNAIRITQPATAEIRLGNVYTNEFIETQVVLTNSANIARKVGFLNLPPNIEIRSPPTTVFSILPSESLPISIAIKAPNGSAGQFTQVLKLLTEHADGCSLTITGQGRTPAIELSPPFIAFPPTAAGASSVSHAVLASRSAVSQDFTFLALARHGISIFPSRGTIKPGERVAVVVTFAAEPNIINLSLPPPVREEDLIAAANAASPPPTTSPHLGPSTTGSPHRSQTASPQAGAKDSNKLPSGKKKTKQDEEAERLEKIKEVEQRKIFIEQQKKSRDEEVIGIRKLIPWEQSAPNEPWALHRDVVIPCSIRPTPASSAFDKDTSSPSSSTSSAPKTAKPLFLTARCCVVRPVATIESAQGPTVSNLATAASITAASAALSPSSPAPKSAKHQSSGSLAGPKAGAKDASPTSKKFMGAFEESKNPTPIPYGDEGSMVGDVANYGLAASSAAVHAITAANTSGSTPVTTLNFGNVPSQQTVPLALIVRHTATQPNAIMQLHLCPLDPYGAYTVTRPPQAVLLKLGDTTEVVVKFKPQQEAIYEQKLVVVCDILVPPSDTAVDDVAAYVLASRHNIVANLTGRGQPAALTITKSSATPVGIQVGTASKAGKKAASEGGEGATPSTPTTAASAGGLAGGAKIDAAFADTTTASEKLNQLNDTLKGVATKLTVDMGTCVAGDSVERYYDYTNCSDFPLTVKTELTNIVNRNPNHMCPFAVNPSVVTIPPKTSVPVCLNFSPSIAGLFSVVLKVRFGGVGSYHDIQLSGRATERGLYVAMPKDLVAKGYEGDAPFSAFNTSHSVAGEGGPSPIIAANLPSATTGLISRRDGLSAMLSLLGTSAVPPPGSVPSHPLQLTFQATATRTFDQPTNAGGNDASLQGKGGKAAERKEEKRLKKELATSNSGLASGSSSARRSPRSIASMQAQDDGPGLSCTISSTTATHQIVIGNNRSSTVGEFLIEGLSEVDQSYGWKVTVASVVVEEGGVTVSTGNATGLGGAATTGGAGLGNTVGSGGPISPNKDSNGKNPLTATYTSTAGTLPPVRGTLQPGQLAVINITFTPKQALIESLPLANVDIATMAEVRVTTRGGLPSTGPEGKVMYLQMKGIVKNSK